MLPSTKKKLVGAFEHNFCPWGQEFEQSNLKKLKCPGWEVAKRGCGSFKLIDALPETKLFCSMLCRNVLLVL